MFALGIRYLTGYSVATDVSNRQQAEWPPHPARVYMAMAAAHFETGEDSEERTALEWLEKQSIAPAMFAGESLPRDVVQCYVPVNDMGVPNNPGKLKPDKVRSALVVIPQFRSNKQPRTFPRTRIDHDENSEPAPVFLIWPDAEPHSQIRAALDRICEKVIRIGHSSSLVQMWVEDDPPTPTHTPDDLGAERLRIATPGTLEMLARSYNREAIEEWADLQEQMANAKGKAKKDLKKQLAERFNNLEPQSLRPKISRWQGYRVGSESVGSQKRASGAFDSNLLVLSIEDGPVVELASTWQMFTAMHKTILKQCDPAPEWLSGHQQDGSPSQEPHVALVPLAFVGQQYADGHLMGIALAFPKNMKANEQGRALAGLLYSENGSAKKIPIKTQFGQWSLERESRPSPPLTLQPEAWTAACDTWATVTPIVLDRHPKTERAKDREKWSIEVAEIISESCERQGLPRPIGVDVDKTSWFSGAPRAVKGDGSGFPLMPVKNGQTKRQQVHAWLRFDQEVAGPLLLGAGRYRGYGVCRPLPSKENRS